MNPGGGGPPNIIDTPWMFGRGCCGPLLAVAAATANDDDATWGGGYNVAADPDVLAVVTDPECAFVNPGMVDATEFEDELTG